MAETKPVDGISKQPATAAGSELFHLKVFSPFETFFDDRATSVSAENETGPFDVLAGHANFMTLLTPCNLTIATPRGKSALPVQRGVMHVRDDEVTVFLNV
jgi:F0F1-type ATP synthase epsilon subunit